MTVICHPERQIPFKKFFLDFSQAFLAEIAGLHDVVFRLFGQLANRADIRIFQTVRRTNRKFQLLDRRVEQLTDAFVAFVNIVTRPKVAVVKVHKD